MASTPLPPFAPFPTAAWKELLSLDEWNASLRAWISLAEAHISLADSEFSKRTLQDESVCSFLSSFMREVAAHGFVLLGTSNTAKILLKNCFLLASRILRSPSTPLTLLQWEFLSDFSRVYSKKRVGSVLSQLTQPSQDAVEVSLAAVKKYLIKHLDEGLKGDLKTVEERLQRLDHIINASPSAASFFLAGSEFLDGLINCYKIMNPPLRKVLVTTTYLSMMGLLESDPPKLSMLTDQLYSLKTAAEAHKAGPLNVNDSLVPELVSTTPLLQQIEHKLEASGAENTRTKNVLKNLGTFKKPGAGMKPKRLIRRKVDKGKAVAQDDHEAMAGEVHVHRMSQITQIQDLFPELGTGFVSRLLDEYDGETEQVVAHLLEDSLPAHLKDADRSEQLYVLFHFIALDRHIWLTLVAGPQGPEPGESPVWCHGQHRHSFPRDGMSLMMTSWISWPSTPQNFILASVAAPRPLTTSLPTAPQLLRRPPSCPPSRHLTRMMTSETTHTTPMT